MSANRAHNIMSIEVDALAYQFQRLIAKATPAPSLDSASSDHLLHLARTTTAPKPFAGPQTQTIFFRYHPLNDWESLFWVSLYMILGRPVEPTADLPQQSNDRLNRQCELARALFNYYKIRSVKFREVPRKGFDGFREGLRACLHEDLLPVAEQLASVRRALVQAYAVAEANPDAYPDGDTSIIYMAHDVFPCYREICSHFEKSRDIEVTPVISA